MRKLNLDEQQIIQLAKDGLASRKIAKVIGCSATKILEILKKHGVKTSVKRPTLKERLESKIKVNEETGCWEWQALLHPCGYGRLRVNGIDCQAHRLSYELYKKKIPERMFVCHHCDVRRCINPDHLFLGTAADNTQDMVRKGRQGKGEKQPNFKLNDLVKTKIISFKSQGLSQRKIAKIVGVHQCTVSRFLLGRYPNTSDTRKINTQKAIYLKSQGYSHKEISKELGVHVASVYNYLKSANPESPPIQVNLFQDS